MNADTETKWFPSKVDTWLAVLLVLIPLTASAGFAGPEMWEPKGILLALSGPTFIVLIYVLLLVPMRYGISGDELIVRHGLIRQRTPLSKILSVQPTRTPISSPALSLDRLKLSTGPDDIRDRVIISPADKEGFMALLAERSGLVRQGEFLVRR